VDDDFKYYGEFSYFREYPDAPDAYELDGMQLAMGSQTGAKPGYKPDIAEDVRVVGGGMAEMGAATVKGAVQGFAGLPGDIEMIGRGVTAIFNRGGDESKVQAFLRGLQEETVLPNTEDIKKWIDTNVGKVGDGENPYETIGEVLAPGGYVKGAKATVKGVKSLAPVAGEMFENYAARTGLTNYIADPARVYSGYADGATKIKPTVRLESSLQKLDAGKIDEQQFIQETRFISEKMRESVESKKEFKPKVRGADEVRRRILGAKIQGDIGEDTAEFALWLLDKNPQLGNNLGINIKGTNAKGFAGQYSSGTQIATLFKSKTNPGTAVHEILHHTERMMPVEIQNGVLDEWNRAYSTALAKADAKTRPYLAKMIDAINGSVGAEKIVMEGFNKGILDYNKHYQLVNPSEFWAVNATRLMQSRYGADSWIGKAKVWVSEMTEKAKGTFGLPSDSPILRGLKEVTGGEGKFKSTEVLAQEQPVARAQIRGIEKEITAKGRKRVAKGAATLGVGSQMKGEDER
jgi:hypothetical protein